LSRIHQTVTCLHNQCIGAVPTSALVQYQPVHWCSTNWYIRAIPTGTFVQYQPEHWCSTNQYIGAVHWCSTNQYIGAVPGAVPTSTLVQYQPVHWCSTNQCISAVPTSTFVQNQPVHLCSTNQYICYSQLPVLDIHSHQYLIPKLKLKLNYNGPSLISTATSTRYPQLPVLRKSHLICHHQPELHAPAIGFMAAGGEPHMAAVLQVVHRIEQTTIVSGHGAQQQPAATIRQGNCVGACACRSRAGVRAYIPSGQVHLQGRCFYSSEKSSRGRMGSIGGGREMIQAQKKEVQGRSRSI
jgi:hypothetical protein